MRVIYVHHAQREKSQPRIQDDKITELGKSDARVMAEHFRVLKEENHLNFKEIITSPYPRCVETAKIINKHLNLPIVEDSRLNEFVGDQTWVSKQEQVRSSIKDAVFSHNDDDAVIFVTSGVNVAAFISLAYRLQPSPDAPFIGISTCSPLGFEITKNHFNNN